VRGMGPSASVLSKIGKFAAVISFQKPYATHHDIYSRFAETTKISLCLRL
jgi:hypothetical protein